MISNLGLVLSAVLVLVTLNAEARHLHSAGVARRNNLDCASDMQPCLLAVYAYTGDPQRLQDHDELIEFIHRTGLEEHCDHWKNITTCVNQKLKNNADCRQTVRSFPEMNKYLDMVNGVVKFICTDRLRDFVRYEDCFTDQEIEEEIEECDALDDFDPDVCMEDSLVKCSDAALDLADPNVCGEGAKELAEDFIRYLFSFLPACDDGLQTLRAMTSYIF